MAAKHHQIVVKRSANRLLKNSRSRDFATQVAIRAVSRRLKFTDDDEPDPPVTQEDTEKPHSNQLDKDPGDASWEAMMREMQNQAIERFSTTWAFDVLEERPMSEAEHRHRAALSNNEDAKTFFAWERVDCTTVAPSPRTTSSSPSSCQP
eukprot:GEZU01013521.1.p1 GENE.GEZU01013521.1~~GEZU01013521.1.p1  ORF type:complete len:150 (-),score=23.86 GEZU01013521.1:24-473(-)